MIFQTYNQDNLWHRQAVSDVEAWSRQAGSAMLPLEADRTADFARRLLAFDDEARTVLGHIAVSVMPERRVMLSGLVISPDQRRKGIGTSLLRQMVAEMSLLARNPESFTSYVNDAALPAYLNIGAVEVGQRTEGVLTECVHIVDLMPAVNRHVNDCGDAGAGALSQVRTGLHLVRDAESAA